MPTVLSICLRTLILELNGSTFNIFIFSVDIVKISFSRILVGLKLPVTEKEVTIPVADAVPTPTLSVVDEERAAATTNRMER